MLKLKLHSCFQVLIYWSVLINISNALIGKKIERVENYEFPFVMSIGAKVVNGTSGPLYGHFHYCTGALITREHILTAEHCFIDTKPHEVQVSVGSGDILEGTKYDVDLIVTFESWARIHKQPIKFDDNDVAIARLAKQVVDPRVIPAVPIYKKARDLYGKDAVTAGWGVSNTGKIPRYMEKTALHVISYTDCMDHVKDIAGKRIIILQNFLCTLTNADALIQSGDSGGPLFIDNKIIAVNGATFPENKPDDDPNVQNIHVQLYYYQEFIEHMLHSSNAHLGRVRSRGQ